MPRRYRMRARSVAVKDTRRRIVDAAMALHAQQGIAGTSHEEIAKQAGVAQATVYRHFPTLDDLIPECARVVQVLRPVEDATIREIFDGLRSPWRRLEASVLGTCDCYARDGAWLAVARGEEHSTPALAAVGQRHRANLRALLEAALEGTHAGERAMRLLVALMDFPFWQSLRDAGFSETEATAQLLALVREELLREGITTSH